MRAELAAIHQHARHTSRRPVRLEVDAGTAGAKGTVSYDDVRRGGHRHRVTARLTEHATVDGDVVRPHRLARVLSEVQVVAPNVLGPRQVDVDVRRALELEGVLRLPSRVVPEARRFPLPTIQGRCRYMKLQWFNTRCGAPRSSSGVTRTNFPVFRPSDVNLSDRSVRPISRNIWSTR